MGNNFRAEVCESHEELQHRLRHALTATTKERLQMLYWIKTKAIRMQASALWAIATRQELSQRLGRDESTVYRWLKRYKQGGIDALLEVKTAPGKSGLIPETVMSQLHERLAQPQGFRSYSQIQEWLTQECQVVVAYKTVHKIVRYKLNAKLKVPRPRSAKALPEVQDAFKKNFQQIFQVLLRYLGTDKQVRYWCQDESRLGLKTLTSRTITLKGVKPVGIVSWQRKNFYLYGVVEPATGDSFFWEFSHLDGTCFQDFLDLFSKAYPDALNLVQMDNGSFHKSLDLKWPDNIIPIFQPANSPELNPIERLWEHIKYELSWEHCTNLDELRRKLKHVHRFHLSGSDCLRQSYA